jgi:hypothetical protein
MKKETEDFDEQVVSVQKAYERKRAQIQESISVLEKEHAEWMNLNNGQKLVRLKIVAALKQNGQVENVYSERVKSSAEQITTHFSTKADAALERIKARRASGFEF